MIKLRKRNYEIELTSYEKFLVSIGQGQSVRYNHRTQS